MNSLRKTPLNLIHHEIGGKMVDFNGWELPIQYDGILMEHRRTRETASIFDVSHMGEFFIQGKDALENVQKLTTNDASQLLVGQAQYSALLYENGTFVDDITVYRIEDDNYMFCVNAGNTEKDFEWINGHIFGECKFSNQSQDYGQLAIQGKRAQTVLQKLTAYPLDEIKYYHFATTTLSGCSVIVARMGYTGEDGFEVFCKADDTAHIWDKVTKEGVPFGLAPAGLGARDTLRLEVNYALYGNEIDHNHSPFEAGLGWIVKMNKGDFIGRDSLLKLKENPTGRKLIAFVVNEKGIPRSHYKIFNIDGTIEIGEVTSGTSSPTLRKGIGMAYVKSEYSSPGTLINIQVRDKLLTATVVKKPIVSVEK